MGGLDASHFVHLPRWTKLAALALLLAGLAASLVVVYVFFDVGGSRDWVMIGLGGGQFMLTTLVLALVLFYSQTDANMATLRDYADAFLAEDGALGMALGRITLGDGSALRVKRGERLDLFGYDYALLDAAGTTVLRLWCGLNVNRLIVIYRVADPQGQAGGAFVDRLRRVFAFSLNGDPALGYNLHYEPVPGARDLVSIWATVATGADLLTNPALKLFWSQDIAMMTQSVLRTALRNPADVRLDVDSAPAPL